MTYLKQRTGIRSQSVGSRRYDRALLRRSILLGLGGAVAGCSDLAGSGPSSADIEAASRARQGDPVRFALIDVSPGTVAAMENWGRPSLLGGFGNVRRPAAQTIGVGDAIQVVIWEAAAGGLFSSAAIDRQSPGSRSATIPEQAVASDGMITVPYAGRIRAAGRSPSQVEAAIVAGLQGKALEPQVLVTVTRNVSNTVTVIGEVTSGARVPLTATVRCTSISRTSLRPSSTGRTLVRKTRLNAPSTPRSRRRSKSARPTGPYATGPLRRR